MDLQTIIREAQSELNQNPRNAEEELKYYLGMTTCLIPRILII